MHVYITKLLIDNNIIPLDAKESYEYGIEVWILKMIHSMTIIAIGLAFSRIVETLLFLLVFSNIRKLAGGYHASTKMRCFSISLIMIFSLCTILNTIKIPNNYLLIMYFICALIVIVKCKTDYKKQLILLMSIIFIINLVLIYYSFNGFFTTICIAVLFASILLIMSIIKEKKL